MIKKFISTFVISVLLIQSAYALSISKYDPNCRLVTMYIPISDRTSSELMQMLQDEFNKIDNTCNNSSMVYDTRMHILIVATLPSNSKYITEFIQKTDKELNDNDNSESANNEKPTHFDDKADDEATYQP